MRPVLDSIRGLTWAKRWRSENGDDSYVIPFATTRPATIVYHGDEPFSYGHYGIHLGQVDRLTFLGSEDQPITAWFIDCREASETLHQRLKIEFTPSSEWTLEIPAGVAHAFDGLESVFTVNEYKLLLPAPARWLAGTTDWNDANDVINIPMNVADDALPTFLANECDASDLFYQLVAERQREAISRQEYEYPFTEDVHLANGETARLQFRRRADLSALPPEWEPIPNIAGLGWVRHLVLPSGRVSGFIPLLDPAPFYVVDHGTKEYSHDAFGIHVGQEDRLTFLGRSDHTVRVTFVDCRMDSPTLHATVSHDFMPSALRYLKIPNGVAHRFDHLGRVFTLNRPALFLDADGTYDSANDVIDWPRTRTPFPILRCNNVPADLAYYRAQAQSQRQQMAKPATYSTPMVVLAEDAAGRSVRVALRRPASSSHDAV